MWEGQACGRGQTRLGSRWTGGLGILTWLACRGGTGPLATGQAGADLCPDQAVAVVAVEVNLGVLQVPDALLDPIVGRGQPAARHHWGKMEHS